MSIVPVRSAAVFVVSSLFLVGCEEGFLENTPTEAEPGTVLQEARTEIQVVERPDIFSTTELGLWDGRPTLGAGAWIAHPDVEAPEGVRVRNMVNGTTIRAALYRRERLSPGPRIQLSSAAAAELGVLAGQPTELEVVVVRDEEIEIEPAVIVPASEGNTSEDEFVEEETINDEAADADGVADEAAAIAVGAGAAAAAAVDEPRPSLWQRFKDSLKNEPDMPEATIAPITDASTMPDVAESAAVPEVETATIGAVAAATAALAAVDAETAAEDEPQVTPPVEGSGLTNPFIQIGLFSQQSNASAAASSLRQSGILPTVVEGDGANGTFWRVLVGPMASATEQAELLAQVKSIGYTDAYLIRN